MTGRQVWTKASWIAAGYLVALLVAFVVVAIYVWAMDSPERRASSGMAAFGDSLLFLGVFGVAAILPTGAALLMLRSYPVFWPRLSIAATLITSTGIAAAAIHVATRNGEAAASSMWPVLAVLRILAAPFLAGAFSLSGLFAPHRISRIVLIVLGLVEAALFASAAAVWLSR